MDGEFYVTDADSDEEPESTQQEYYVDMPDTDEESEGTHQTTEDTQPTEDTEPMEVTQPTEDPVVTSCTYEHDVDVPTSGRLTWTIENFSSLNVLDIQLPKLEDLKILKVAFCSAKIGVTIYTIMLRDQSTVLDVLDDLKTKVELSHPDAELRLLEIFYHKIRKIFSPHERIGTIDHHRTLRAEEIPEEEKNLGPHDRLIHVYHFMDTTQNELVTNFGEPFILVLHEGETLAEIKARIQKKLQVLDDEFLKWKFALVSRGYPKYLEDSEILSKCFEKSEVCSDWEQYLGMEHTDNAPKCPDSSILNPSKFEKDKPLIIYN